MRHTLLAAAFFLLAATASAQNVPLTTALRTYGAAVLPKCPGGVVTLDAVEGSGPAGFSAFAIQVKSSDEYCGTQKYLLYSNTSQQILIGAVIPLPEDNRPVAARVSAEASRLLGHEMSATLAPAILPDKLRAVAMARETPYGRFAYNGFVDAAERFLIVGFRGSLTVDPSTTLRQAFGLPASAVFKGNPKAAVEIIEISEFQCPTCANAYAKLKPIIDSNLPRINYARIDLPLFEHHEWALPAALAARAVWAVAPLRYWDFVDETFRNQEAIGKMQFDEYFQQFAMKYGLDWPALQRIYNSRAERQAMLEQVSRMFAVGIAAVPTYIVNGTIMGFGPEGSFTIDAIKAALAEPAR